MQTMRTMKALLPAILLVMASASVAPAADTEPTSRTATLQATPARAGADTRFSAEFQAAMEKGDVRAARQACGKSCPARSNQIAAPGTEPPKYTCNSGNCACAGASDCVLMAPICEEGTIGCNDYGCTCKEGGN